MNKMHISGADVWPIFEGGKGINASNGFSAGAFAAAGAVGTVSGTLPFVRTADGIHPLLSEGKTRLERHQNLIKNAIAGGIDQIKLAHEIASGKGRIHVNYLWEAGGTRHILKDILEQTKGLLHGVVAGAGIPFEMAPMAEAAKVFYYPIVSSVRVFQLLWKRSFQKHVDFLGGVIYEDPWHAGGHNGLSNREDPLVPQRPYERLVALRQFMKEVKLEHVPIIIAGKVWGLDEWQDYIDNKEIGPVAFQFGTRPLLTKESPIPQGWKDTLRTLKKEDLVMTQLSPTGFWSSAIKNDFLKDLLDLNDRQVPVRRKSEEDFTEPIALGPRQKTFFFSKEDAKKVQKWIADGYTVGLNTPSKTMVFATPQQTEKIAKDQADCAGCLSRCRFSSWAEREESHTTNLLPDPRSFCIQKTLNEATMDHDPQTVLLFSGSQAYRFASDPLFADNHEPTIAQLVETILDNR